jgi:hypothetical protein
MTDSELFNGALFIFFCSLCIGLDVICDEINNSDIKYKYTKIRIMIGILCIVLGILGLIVKRVDHFCAILLGVEALVYNRKDGKRNHYSKYEAYYNTYFRIYFFGALLIFYGLFMISVDITD